MEKSPVAPNRILLIPLGFTIWSVAFVALYATNAIGCAFGWDPVIQRSVLVALMAGFLGVSALAGWLVYRYWRDKAEAEGEPAPSLAIISIYGCCTAVIATIGTFVPVFGVSLCV